MMKLKFEIALGILKETPAGEFRKMYRKDNPFRVIYIQNGLLYENYNDKYCSQYTASNDDMMANDWIISEETAVPIHSECPNKQNEAVEAEITISDGILDENDIKYQYLEYNWNSANFNTNNVLLC